jgi:hypothetical protein
MSTTNQNTVQETAVGNENGEPLRLDSELQLVSSLAKLQELERKVSPWPAFSPQP